MCPTILCALADSILSRVIGVNVSVTCADVIRPVQQLSWQAITLDLLLLHQIAFESSSITRFIIDVKKQGDCGLKIQRRKYLLGRGMAERTMS